MKIELNGKTYESIKITAGMTRRALELNVAALDAATKAENLKASTDPAAALQLLSALSENMKEKAELICSAFGDAFDSDSLLDQVENAELNGLINKIALGKD